MSAGKEIIRIINHRKTKKIINRLKRSFESVYYLLGVGTALRRVSLFFGSLKRW